MSGQYRNLRPQTGGGRSWPLPSDARSPREFGEDANHLSVKVVKLTAARTDVRIKAIGNFIWAIDASDLDAELEIKFNRQDGTGIPFSQGTAFGGVGFNELYITNEAQAGKTITFLIGVARDASSLFLLNAASSFTSIKLDKANTFSGSGEQAITTATTDTIAANTDRREIIIQADAGNTDVLMVRDSSGNNAAELDAGQSITLEVTDAIQVRNDSGSGQTYRYFEIAE